jgi:hypothetical protein
MWFRDALSARGETVDSLDGWAAADTLQQVPDGAVPVLLRALRDKDWFVARNAAFLLTRRMEADGRKDAPAPIDYASTPPEREAAIAAYHDWWAVIVEKRRADEKG